MAAYISVVTKGMPTALPRMRGALSMVNANATANATPANTEGRMTRTVILKNTWNDDSPQTRALSSSYGFILLRPEAVVKKING